MLTFESHTHSGDKRNIVEFSDRVGGDFAVFGYLTAAIGLYLRAEELFQRGGSRPRLITMTCGCHYCARETLTASCDSLKWRISPPIIKNSKQSVNQKSA